jgi:hypothetical protein
MSSAFTRLARLAAALGLCLVCTAGCHTVSTSLVPYLGVAKHPPTDPAKVEFLQKEPTRPFVKLGEVTAAPDSGTSAEKIEAALRREAAKLGADAVVLIHDKMQVVGSRVWGPAWAPEFSDVNQRLIVVLAIKYE